MTANQAARLAYLDDLEVQTPAEEAEHAYLLRLHSDLCQAFETLREQGMQPTWLGEYILANPANAAPVAVHSLIEARRLALAA